MLEETFLTCFFTGKCLQIIEGKKFRNIIVKSAKEAFSLHSESKLVIVTEIESRTEPSNFQKPLYKTVEAYQNEKIKKKVNYFDKNANIPYVCYPKQYNL